MGKKAKVKVESGCRDCKACTNPAVANAGRATGRFMMGVMTFGTSEAARGFTRNCATCGHKMSLHGHTSMPEIVQTVPTVATEPAMRSGDWHTRHTPATPPAAAPAGVEELARLGEMHTAGMLSDEEFAAAKARLLGL